MVNLKGIIKNKNILNRAIAIFCVLAMTVVMVLTVLPGLVDDTSAALTPGTDAYLAVRGEEAKVKVGWIYAGENYTDYTGTAAAVAADGPWMLENLKTKYDAGELSAPWNGVDAGTIPTATRDGGAYNIATNPYKVATAEEFRYCVKNGCSMFLTKDIDLGGYLGHNWIFNGNHVGADIFGNGHTIYNMYYLVNSTTYTAGYCSLLGVWSGTAVKRATIQNFHVSNSHMNITGSGPSATLFITHSAYLNLYDCSISKSVNIGYKTQHQSIFASWCGNVTALSCYTDNTHIISDITTRCYSQMWEAALPNCVNVLTNCYSTNSTNVGGTHSGGFESCCYGTNTFNNCFTNIEMYGNQIVGAFAGSTHNGYTTFNNCFTSGMVIGNAYVAGFCVDCEYYSGMGVGRENTFNNCYSTAMVGMYANSPYTGGFYGFTTGGQTMTVNDCYAAGEVGYFGSEASNSNRTAGFIGDSTTSNHDFNHCYYDMQTTAMREHAMYQNGKLFTSDDCQQPGTVDNFDIKGVLTADSTKQGTGLTSAPGTTGFTGFSDNSQWVFEDEHYPQLAVAANATVASYFANIDISGCSAADQAKIQARWAEQVDLIHSFSFTSTSTVFLPSWDTDWDGNPLPKTTYDTVRDLTQSGIYLTTDSSMTNQWSRVGTSLDPTGSFGTGAKANIFGEIKDVLILEDPTISYSGKWEIPRVSQGIDWLRIDADKNGQSTFRKLRLCPTNTLDPGQKVNIVNIGDTYDHAADMRMAYSTAAALAAGYSGRTNLTAGGTASVTGGSGESLLIDGDNNTKWLYSLPDLASGKTATASSSDSVNVAANITDDNDSNYWTAENKKYTAVAAKATSEQAPDHTADKAIDGDKNTTYWLGTPVTEIPVASVSASSENSATETAGNLIDSDDTNAWKSISTSGTNFATGSTVTTSGDANPSSAGSKAVDGNRSTYWMAPYDKLEHWIRLDLGAAQTINTVSWYASSGTIYGGCNVQVSTNGATWTTVQSFSSLNSDLFTASFTPTTARYVRLDFPATSNNRNNYINEIWVYNSADYDIFPSVTADLGSVQSVGALKLSKTDGGTQYFNVLTSTDGTTWTTFAANQYISTNATVDLGGTSAQYIKINYVLRYGLPQTLPVTLNTLKVYEPVVMDSLYIDLGSNKPIGTVFLRQANYAVYYSSIQTCPNGSNPDVDANWTTVVANQYISSSGSTVTIPAGTTARYIRYLPTGLNDPTAAVGLYEMTAYGPNDKPNIYVDLGSSQTVDRINLKWWGSAMGTYDVQVCAAGNNPANDASWTTVLTNQTSTSGMMAFPSAVAAQYIRLKVTDISSNKDPVGLYYLKVYNGSDGLPSATVDLGSATVIDTISVYWANTNMGSYSLYTSVDNVTWTRVARKSVNASGLDETFITPTSARYVRLDIDKLQPTATSFSVGEISVYAEDDIGTLEAIYGVYPETTLSTQSDNMLGLGVFQNKTALTALYATQDGTYENINTGAMQRTSTNITSYPAATATIANAMKCEVQKITSYNGDGTYNLGPSLTTGGTADATMQAKFAGKTAFEAQDKGKYKITYYWALADGRYASGYKLLTVGGENPLLSVYVKRTDETPNPGVLFVDAHKTADATDFGTATKDSDYVLVDRGTDAIAEWKKINSIVTVSKATLTLTDTNGVDHSATVTNPTNGSTFTIPMKYYTQTVDGFGNITITEHDVTRTFTIVLTGDVYSITFDDTDTVNNYYNDLDVDTTLTLYSDDNTVSISTPGGGFVAVDAVPSTLTSDAKIVASGGTAYVQWAADSDHHTDTVTMSINGGAAQNLYFDDTQPTKVFTDAACTTQLPNAVRDNNKITFSNVTSSIAVTVLFASNETPITLHVRQVVKGATLNSDGVMSTKSGTLAVPSNGYVKITNAELDTSNNILSTGAVWNKTVFSSNENVTYTEFVVVNPSGFDGDTITGIIPMNYKLQKVTAKALSADAETDVITDPYLLVTSTTDNEWWVTVWLEPSFTDPEPGYSIDNVLNEFGEIVFPQPIQIPAQPMPYCCHADVTGTGGINDELSVFLGASPVPTSFTPVHWVNDGSLVWFNAVELDDPARLVTKITTTIKHGDVLKSPNSQFLCVFVGENGNYACDFECAATSTAIDAENQYTMNVDVAKLQAANIGKITKMAVIYLNGSPSGMGCPLKYDVEIVGIKAD